MITYFCLMEAIEPREEEMEPISYEVENDLLIEYAFSLLASVIDKNKKRLDTYIDRVSQNEPSNKKSEKKKKEIPTLPPSSIGGHTRSA